jgi:hypothetical protein
VALGRVAIERRRLSVPHSSNPHRQGASELLGGGVGATDGELDLLVDLAGEAPGSILRPHEVRCLIVTCC